MYIVLAGDAHLGVAVKDWFDRHGMGLTEVVALSGGSQWLTSVESIRPSAVVLTARAPDALVMRACRLVAGGARSRVVPLVVALAEADEEARIAILDAGADAVVHPFDLTVIEWQLRVVCDPTRGLRTYEGHDLSLAAGGMVVAAGQQVMLTAIEASILRALLQRPNRVISRRDFEHWLGRRSASRTVDVHIVRLRKKLGAFGQRIQTVRKVGYRYAPTRPSARSFRGPPPGAP
jgi:DNA-binding response OmpR family regulator